jgi:hypothetical protein
MSSVKMQREQLEYHILRFLLLFLIPQAIRPILAASACGSLITYRQHSFLLETAPQCFRNGCQNGETVTTISSPCPPQSSCYVLWNTFTEQFHQDWCSSCKGDIACRIQGWPILNATAFCDSTPNQLVFMSGSCCVSDNEPFELAAWIGNICNGSQWRQPFEKYGGMASTDWMEWISPWNWTVDAQNSTSQTVSQSPCSRPSLYLGLFGIEHFFWLATAIFVGGFRLGVAKVEEHKENAILRYLWSKIRVSRGQLKNSSNESLRQDWFQRNLGWVVPVSMGILMAALQVGFNLAAAYHIKNTPGYGHVPAGRLALLFCCRPRIAWLACALALIPDSRLVKIFKFRENGDGVMAARMILSSVAVSSAVSECIMQLLGAYYFGTTANTGRTREFYLVHHLRPLYHGRDALHMYFGGLFWVIACVLIVPAWFLVALFYATFYGWVSDLRERIWKALQPRATKLPNFSKPPVVWLLDKINPHPQTTQPLLNVDNIPRNSDEQMLGDTIPHTGPNPFDHQLPSGTLSNRSQSQYEHQLPRGVLDRRRSDDTIQQLPGGLLGPSEKQTLRRHPYTPVSQIDMDEQQLPVGVLVSNVPGPTRVIQRRTPSGNSYTAVSQSENDDQPLPRGLLSPQSHQSSPINRRTSNPEMTQIRYGGNSITSMQSSNQEPSTQPVLTNISNYGTTRLIGAADETRTPFKWERWERWIIIGGVTLGLISYAAQWLFWDGFVKASGARWVPCPHFT